MQVVIKYWMRSLLVWGMAIEPVMGSSHQAEIQTVALRVISQSLAHSDLTLGQVVEHMAEELNLPVDSARVTAQMLVRTGQQMLKKSALQKHLEQRWGEVSETEGLEVRKGISFLQALSKETEKALQKKGDYLVKTLVARAARKGRLPEGQVWDVLRVAVGGSDITTSQEEPADTLFLEVLSRELVDQVPGYFDSEEMHRFYYKYWNVLFSEYRAKRFLCFFLTASQKKEVWEEVAQQLIAEDICRQVVVVPRQKNQAPLSHPRITLYASFMMPEANSDWRGGLPVHNPQGRPGLSERLKTRYVLQLFYALTLSGAKEPAWEHASAVQISVDEFGPHPDPSDTRQFPVKITYEESIVEPVFIEFFRQKLAKSTSRSQ